MKIKVLVSMDRIERLEVDVSPGLTVREFRIKVTEALPALSPWWREHTYRYRGTKMACERTLRDLSITEGDTVHVQMHPHAREARAWQQHQAAVAAAPPPSAEPSPIGGLDAAALPQGMDNPFTQQIMADPEMLRSILLSNPQMKALVESNPEIGHILSDPNMLRQTMETARNPALMREQMRGSDRAMSNIESHPEGFNALRRMYSTIQEPLSQIGMPGSDLADSQASEEETTRSLQSETPNTTALPNPWAAPPPSQVPQGPAQGLPWVMPSQGQQRQGQEQPSPFMPPLGALGGLGGLGGLGALFEGLGTTPGAQPPTMANPHGLPPAGAEMYARTRAALEQIRRPFPPRQGTGAGPSAAGTSGAGGPAGAPDATGAAMHQAMQAILADNARMRAQAQDPSQGMYPRASNLTAAIRAALAQGAPVAFDRSTSITEMLEASHIAHAQAVSRYAMAPWQPPVNGQPAWAPWQPPADGQVGEATRRAAETRYASEMAAIADMGFDDPAKVLDALIATGGNINAAIARLLG
jgi:hypothetical protein